jgi:electron-transferring-flavoprotein dehydrogenase
MGEDMLTLGMVVGLDYRDVELSVHDLLQELKTHPLVRKLLEGGERVAWGAKTIPEGGFLALPKQLHAPGLLIVGDGAGLVNVPALKGIHYAIESGRLAAEAAFASLQRGQTPATPGALAGYDESLRESFVWKDLQEVRNMRPAFGLGIPFPLRNLKIQVKDTVVHSSGWDRVIVCRNPWQIRGFAGRVLATDQRTCERQK